MSKRIDAARKRLNQALKKHAEVVGGSAVSIKKSQRAAAEVREAALAYAEIVVEKTGQPSPFDGLKDTSALRDTTIASLKSERDKIASKPAKKAS
ncbi:hypothetical protein QT381_05120 [Galbitalea sp. SE-J8]|uniref:hypothetical protein n=1 Tax=Galbitalea sp. SE-J8 TaxID=3054952 RepID=UPI00259D1CA6|nr:hypothetical protein [Galbitalea sp. SE-J8]MDM4762385.1 hypothetical protein [Galbitalea sp. SE-J8]